MNQIGFKTLENLPKLPKLQIVRILLIISNIDWIM